MTSTLGRGHRRGRGLQVNLPWEVSSAHHILGVLVPGSDSRKINSLTWFEKQWDWQQGYRKPRLCLWRAHTHICLLLKQSKGSKLKLSKTMSGFLWLYCCMPKPEPNALSGPAHPSAQLTLRWGLTWLREVCDFEGWNCSGLGKHLNRVRMATAAT